MKFRSVLILLAACGLYAAPASADEAHKKCATSLDFKTPYILKGVSGKPLITSGVEKYYDSAGGWCTTRNNLIKSASKACTTLNKNAILVGLYFDSPHKVYSQGGFYPGNPSPYMAYIHTHIRCVIPTTRPGGPSLQ